MIQVSNSDLKTIVRLLEWASVQGGPSLLDANKRRVAGLLYKKLKQRQHENDQRNV